MSALGTLMTTFLGISVGAAIALGLTIKTVAIPDVYTYMAFWAGFLVSLGFSVILLGVSIWLCARAASDVNRIKAESEQEKRQRELLQTQEG
jgi:predicted phage tail protein